MRRRRRPVTAPASAAAVTTAAWGCFRLTRIFISRSLQQRGGSAQAPPLSRSLPSDLLAAALLEQIAEAVDAPLGPVVRLGVVVHDELRAVLERRAIDPIGQGFVGGHELAAQVTELV